MRLRDYLNINVWLLPILLIFVPVVLLLFGSSFLTTPSNYYMTILDDGWSITHGDFHVDNVGLKNLDIGSANKNDVVTIQRRIPTENIPAACLMFRSWQATITASIDGKVVYSYGDNYAEKKHLIPKHFNFIPLDISEVGGKMITITYEVHEDNAFSGLAEVYFGNRHDVVLSYIQKRRLPFFVGNFLVTFGLLLLTLSSYLFLNHGHDLTLVFSALISLSLGSYNLAFNDIFCLLSDYEVIFCLVEYISLYSIPFNIIAFLLSSHPELNSNINKTILAINILFPVITFALHLFNIVHMNNFVSTLHVIALSEAVMLMPQLIIAIINRYADQDRKKEYVGRTSDSMLVIGLLLFIVCSVVDIIKYNIFKFFVAGGEVSLNINFMTIGALCFVLFLFLSYFYHGIEHINAVYMKEHLEGLAYTDSLTGLMNRAKCMQYMASVKGRYAIISLDMDNLKTVNDSLGHLEGDRMLKAFADILKQTFLTATLVGRTGGDEFLVAIDEPAPDTCEKLLEDLKARIAAFNKNETSFNLSASFGFAYSNEVSDMNANSVFELADNRMYAEKEIHHASKIDRFVSDIIASSNTGEGGVKKDE